MHNTWFIRLACEKACVNVIEIGTAENHIHLLFRFSANQRLSDIIGMIKSCSSREISKYDNSFPGWQTGYYVSSIGNTKLGNIQDYLKNQ
jgi:REP element-mobilizing transposase RayT